MIDTDLTREARAVLDTLPSASGGVAVALATSSTPPAMAMLSTGDVLWREDELRIGIHASSSVVSRLGAGLTLLVPLGERACRIEAVEATADVQGPLALVRGRVTDVRPTAEPPWLLEMGFRPVPPDHPRVETYVRYWADVRAWLEGVSSRPPAPPG